jgi:hypothetical protein
MADANTPAVWGADSYALVNAPGQPFNGRAGLLVVSIDPTTGKATAPGGTPGLPTLTPAAQNLTNVSQTIKSSAGSLVGWYLYNPNTTPAYITLTGAAVPFTLTLPPGGAANTLGAGGIGFAATLSAIAWANAAGNSALAAPCTCSWFYA